ncbi:MAG: dephospho-CoA kinase, partial [Clostridiales bacterium]|nr:dephospho-CoA kinase [Clostridiales bacterium]
YVPQKEQVRRLITRDGLTTREALRRIRSQMPALHKARLSDRVIRTDGSPSESAAKVVTLWQDVLRRYALV